MAAPVLTWWWHVGETVRHLSQYYDKWLKVLQSVINVFASGTTKNEVASWLNWYLQTDALKAQLLFLVDFHSDFFCVHLKWLQHEDPMTKQLGFLAMHMPVRYYIMVRDLEELEEKWTSLPEYQDYLSIVGSLPESTYVKKELKEGMRQFGSFFLKIAKEKLEKSFEQWRCRNLEVMLGGETKTAQGFACWLVGKDIAEEEEYWSEIHKSTIHIKKMVEFLTGKTTVKKMTRKSFFQNYSRAIIELANGGNIFQGPLTKGMSILKRHVMEKYYPLPSNTQFVESGVKEAKICHSTNRNDMMRSMYAFIRSKTVRQGISDAVEERDQNQEKMRGNRYVSAGKKNERKRKMEDGTLQNVEEIKIRKRQSYGARRNKMILTTA